MIPIVTGVQTCALPIYYNMNKKIYSLSELMNELVAAEGILGTSNVEANVGEASDRKSVV